jgi:hypothetical protein
MKTLKQRSSPSRGTAADQGWKHTDDIPIRQQPALSGMLPIDQDDPGEIVRHTQHLHESLDGLMFMHIYLQARAHGVRREQVTKCGEEPDRHRHAWPFSRSAGGAG